MQALDVLDNPLQWETERQNRIHQVAIEQKKKQMRADDARRERQLVGNTSEGKSPAFSVPSGAITHNAAGIADQWTDKVRHIPDMRLALIPLDEGSEGKEWSKPFSLFKADMEPWLSFYQGYRESRLFLEASSSAHAHAGDASSERQLDFPVRALLELKKVSTKIILEPPVQINGLVEYHDLDGELSVCRDPALAKALFKVANEVHENHLRRAIESGRAMGNALHEALMGDGHVNLINSWEKVFSRKPTIDELHQMLTTGRVKISTERRQQAPEPKTPAQHSRPTAISRDAMLTPRREPPPVKAAPQPEADIAVKPADVQAKSAIESSPQHHRNKKILWRLLHAAIGCAALIAYGLVV